MTPQTPESYWSEMIRVNNNGKLRKNSAYAFDVAWVIALALNAAFTDGMTYESLQKRTYREVRLIKKWIERTNFQGLTVSRIQKIPSNKCPKMFNNESNGYQSFHII